MKTRLAANLGDENARDVYVVFLQHLVNYFSGFGDKRTVVFTPAKNEREFRMNIPLSWGLREQADGDLGARMRHFFRTICDPEDKNILIGSDTPDLPIEILDEAVRELERVPVVIGPSGDGGYYLIGATGEMPEVFDDMPWSTDQVLQRTIKRLDEMNCEYHLLPELKDVDEIGDLQMLMANLRSSEIGCELLTKLDQLELGIV